MQSGFRCRTSFDQRLSKGFETGITNLAERDTASDSFPMNSKPVLRFNDDEFAGQSTILVAKHQRIVERIIENPSANGTERRVGGAFNQMVVRRSKAEVEAYGL